MKPFNLSDWALNHRSFVWFLMIISLVAGALAYMSIGREEDPNFSIKTMIIAAALPGPDTQETLMQVTNRIEEKLEDLDQLDVTRSVTRPGEAIVYIELLPTTNAADLPIIWQEVRNMMADIRGDIPSEFGGFLLNDSLGDVFGKIYAVTSDGFSLCETHDYVQQIIVLFQLLVDAVNNVILGMTYL